MYTVLPGVSSVHNNRLKAILAVKNIPIFFDYIYTLRAKNCSEASTLMIIKNHITNVRFVTS